MIGLNHRAGLRKRGYRRDSEYRVSNVALECPWRDTPRGDRSPPSQGRNKARNPFYSPISTRTPVWARKAEHVGSEEAKSECEQSSATTLDVGGLCLVPGDDSAAVMDTGSTANLVCFRWPVRRNLLSEKRGRQKVATYPSSARFRFGDGRLADVRHAAGIPADIAGSQGDIAGGYRRRREFRLIFRRLRRMQGFPRYRVEDSLISRGIC